MNEVSITKSEAKILATSAQGFRARSMNAEFRLSDFVYELGALQLDFVSRVAASQYLVIASRRPNSSLDDIQDQLFRYEDVVEGEFHAASLISKADFIDFWPYLSRRRGAMRRSHRKALGDEPWELLERVESVFQESTVLTASDIETLVPNASPKGWWGRRTGRIALDALHFQGRITIHHRDGRGRPHYCRPGHVQPPEEFQFDDSEVTDALDRMIFRSLESLGCASLPHIADFYRLPREDVEDSISRLLDFGRICPVRVQFDSAPWYSTPEAIDCLDPKTAFGLAPVALSPFDSLIWNRSRTKLLFDFDYVNTMYYSKEKREKLGLGYYVLPILTEDGFVGRADVAKDEGELVLMQAWLENEECNPESILDALNSLASWLGTSLRDPSSTPIRIC